MSATIALETITPTKAYQWLEGHIHNRKLRPRAVEELKGAIARGEWQVTTETIKFNSDGTLIDGQHRLWACIEADTPIKSYVARGVSHDVRRVIDRGAKRNLSDELKIEGYKSATALASAVVAHWKIVNNLVRTSTSPTVTQALIHLDENPDLLEGVKTGLNYAKRLYGSPSMMSALFVEFSAVDPDAAETFMAQVITGAGHKQGDPTYALRRVIETHEHGTVMLAALTIKAWNAYLAGNKVDKLSWRPVGKMAEPFPAIKG